MWKKAIFHQSPGSKRVKGKFLSQNAFMCVVDAVILESVIQEYLGLLRVSHAEPCCHRARLFFFSKLVHTHPILYSRNCPFCQDLQTRSTPLWWYENLNVLFCQGVCDIALGQELWLWSKYSVCLWENPAKVEHAWGLSDFAHAHLNPKYGLNRPTYSSTLPGFHRAHTKKKVARAHTKKKGSQGYWKHIYFFVVLSQK